MKEERRLYTTATQGGYRERAMSNMAAAPTDAGPKKRLVIKKMVLENFKSYAGAQHVGPFHKVRFLLTSSSSFVVVVCVVATAL